MRYFFVSFAARHTLILSLFLICLGSTTVAGFSGRDPALAVSSAGDGAVPFASPSSTPTCCMLTGTIQTSCQYHATDGTYDINLTALINNPCGQTQTQAANFYLEVSVDGSSFSFIRRTSIENYIFQPGLNTINESFLNETIDQQYQYYRIRMQIHACGIYEIYSPAAPVCRPGGTPTPTSTPGSTPTPTGTPTPTPGPTPTPTVNISGTVLYCSNPVPGPVANVTLTLTGTVSDSTLSDRSGNYQFSSLPSGGSYTVTPAKAALPPGSAGIDTVDVIAVQRHLLNLGTPLSGCRLAAADVNGDNLINTVDVIAIQRFLLSLTTGIANTGKYQFTPASRTYTGPVTNQTGQNYDTIVFGDVAAGFVELVDGPSQEADDGTSAGEVPAIVAAVALPEVALDASTTDFIAAVTTSTMNANDQLVGFQRDLTFDERVVTFQSEPVQKAGLTGGNWNVSGNVLPGTGPIRTLRISAYSNDFTPLSGSGTLFELRMTRVSQAAQSTQLIWAAPPDQFIFIDADLKMQKPGYAAPGSVSPRSSQR